MKFGKRHDIFGLSTLLFNIVSLNCVLLWLRGRPNQSATEVLALGNLLLGLVAVIPSTRLRALPRPSLKLIIIWSIGYCFTYYSFVMWPKLLPLSLLRVAQTVAPTAAVFVTGDWRKEDSSKIDIVFSAIALLLLAGVVFFQKQAAFQSSGLLLFLGVAAYDVVSQSIARISIRKVPSLWISVHLSLANGIILCTWELIQKHTFFTTQIATDSGLLALGILAVQVPMFVGLKLTRPMLAALILATGVPVGILIEAAATHNWPHRSMLITSLLFTLTVVVSTLVRERQKSKLNLTQMCDGQQVIQVSADV